MFELLLILLILLILILCIYRKETFVNNNDLDKPFIYAYSKRLNEDISIKK